MNTFQLIVAIAFGTFFGGMLNAIFGFVLDIANRKNYEKLEEQRMEEVREKSKELATIITGEIEKANPNLTAKPIKDGKGVKVSAKESQPVKKPRKINVIDKDEEIKQMIFNLTNQTIAVNNTLKELIVKIDKQTAPF